MHKLKSKFLSLTSLENFELQSENVSSLGERTILIKKWDWDYDRAHQFQKHCVSLLQEQPQLRVLIMCSHPELFTNGRGLQKPKKGETLELVDFKAENYPTLPFPLFQIERGGGLTFHHPGQFVFYPIVKLHPQNLSLSKMMDDIFQASIGTLEDWGVRDLTTQNKFLGLWYQNRKLASMGIAIERLTTFHGMALNLRNDEDMNRALNFLNPCGLSAKTYMAVEEIVPLPADAHEKFAEGFMERLNRAW